MTGKFTGPTHTYIIQIFFTLLYQEWYEILQKELTNTISSLRLYTELVTHIVHLLF